ncbi:MAG: P1 family peptidase [marine benthic group bacterium]|jgi:L-aminopeptidase/D-esterase-like protein|nr:P1 family peptidase [Gemmatimonadota bacterium]MCL7936929.1 P1 family peptidase [Gemmatimonadota bacterium]MCL7964066.1 P1 family peptidase [Gemmatimonadota bacterium]MCL7969932.1 P1 family peptidase [Gemmatimonadota bacterium]MCL7975501.1 P1 family peptidase [Gemmatimonadota bacterium]
MRTSIGFLTAFALLPGAGSLSAQDTTVMSITDVPGIRVGHHTLAERPTGCTVVLAPAGATAGVDVRGGAPGTRETALLDPVNTVSQVHAVVLSGGSAFGLDAASGATSWLEEQGIGYEAGGFDVPIVVAAILFDLGVGDGSLRPGAECGYEAARGAVAAAPAEGNVGAGAGATVGKLRGMERAMKGGIGSASVRGSDGLVVGALIAANPLGDVIDPATGDVIAGVRTEDGTGLADARRLLSSESGGGARDGHSNTVIGVIATNAVLTKSEATMVARMAHDGLARAVWPAHTPWDGDTLFVLSTGDASDAAVGHRADLTEVGALAADVVTEAILRAVRAAESLPGLPAAGDLGGSL